jgi:hypothetical protein
MSRRGSRVHDCGLGFWSVRDDSAGCEVGAAKSQNPSASIAELRQAPRRAFSCENTSVRAASRARANR